MSNPTVTLPVNSKTAKHVAAWTSTILGVLTQAGIKGFTLPTDVSTVLAAYGPVFETVDHFVLTLIQSVLDSGVQKPN